MNKNKITKNEIIKIEEDIENILNNYVKIKLESWYFDIINMKDISKRYILLLNEKQTMLKEKQRILEDIPVLRNKIYSYTNYKNIKFIESDIEKYINERYIKEYINERDTNFKTEKYGFDKKHYKNISNIDIIKEYIKIREKDIKEQNKNLMLIENYDINFNYYYNHFYY